MKTHNFTRFEQEVVYTPACLIAVALGLAAGAGLAVYKIVSVFCG